MLSASLSQAFEFGSPFELKFSKEQVMIKLVPGNETGESLRAGDTDQTHDEASRQQETENNEQDRRK